MVGGATPKGGAPFGPEVRETFCHPCFNVMFF
jgi:hypothetical protein